MGTENELKTFTLPSTEHEVQALSELITHKDTPLSLCVGLFGDLGMGKTRFLSQMQQRIEAIASSSRRALLAGQTTRFCAEIEQIRFNAWHYQELNLSACLVDHIFDSLAHRYQPPTEPTREGSIQALLYAKQSLSQAESDLEKARLETVEAKTRLERQQEEIVQLKQKIGAQDLVGLMRANPTLQAQLNRALQVLRLPELTRDVELIRAAHREAGGLQKRMESAFNQLFHGEDKGRRWRALAFWLFVVPLVALSVALLITEFKQDLDPAIATIGAVLAALGTAAARARAFFSRFTQALDVYDQSLAAVDAVLAEVDAQREKLMEANQSLLAQKEAAEAVASQALQDAQDSLTAAEQAVEDLKRSRTFPKFILSRSASTDYDAQLSFLRVVEDDLRRLFELLQPSDDPDDPPPVERIVLYLGDLNRCSVEQVHNVLRAVNLLLSFDLFVVVMSLDARRLLRPVDAPMFADVRAYLENTFQLPYQMRPLDPFDLERTIAERLNLDTRTDPGVLLSWAPDVEHIEVGEHEREFMTRLSALLGSPRGVGRFVATYLMARAALSKRDKELFAPDEPSFKAVQIMLAVLAGEQEEAPRFIRELQHARDVHRDWPSFLLQISPDTSPNSKEYSASWANFCVKLRGLYREGERMITVHHFISLLPLLSRLSLDGENSRTST